MDYTRQAILARIRAEAIRKTFEAQVDDVADELMQERHPGKMTTTFRESARQYEECRRAAKDIVKQMWVEELPKL